MSKSVLYSSRRAVKVIASYDTYRNFPLKIENDDVKDDRDIIFIKESELHKIENDNSGYVSYHKKEIIEDAILRANKAHGVKIKQAVIDKIRIDKTDYVCTYCTVCTKKSKDKNIINHLLNVDFIDYDGSMDFPFRLLLI